MSYINISETAKILKVSTKTLIRWDEDGQFPAERETVSRGRIYDAAIVEKARQWLELRRKHRELLNKLGPIREELSRFIVTKPLEPLENPKMFNGEELSKAVKAMQDWEDQLEGLEKEYSRFSTFYWRIEAEKDEK